VIVVDAPPNGAPLDDIFIVDFNLLGRPARCAPADDATAAGRISTEPTGGVSQGPTMTVAGRATDRAYRRAGRMRLRRRGQFVNVRFQRVTVG